MLYFTILWALFAGIGDPFLGLTLKKPKENQCFWLRTLKNLRKINVFIFPDGTQAQHHQSGLQSERFDIISIVKNEKCINCNKWN